MEAGAAKAETPAGNADGTATLFVRNLSYKTTSEGLTTFMADFAPVRHAVVVSKSGTTESMGFGFVTFSMRQDAATAIEQSKGRKLDGRVIKAEFAKPRARGATGDSKKPAPEEGAAAVKPDTPSTTQNASRRLIVRNLPWSVRNPKQLQPQFAKFGKVRECVIPRGKGGRMTGFAFVEFVRPKAAAQAVEGCKEMKIDGRPVAVDFAISKAKWEQANQEDDDDAEDDDEEDENVEEEEEEEEEEDDDDDDSDGEEDEVEQENEGLSEESELSESNESEEESEGSLDFAGSDGQELENQAAKPKGFTVFVRNVSYDTTQESLYEFFRQFGPLNYAVLTYDQETGIPRGTAFVCFRHESDMRDCVAKSAENKSDELRREQTLLADESTEVSRDKFILDGRGLVAVPAVDRGQAQVLKEEGEKKRRAELGKGLDKRRMFLLNEGRLSRSAGLSESDVQMRQQSLDQRTRLLQSNPSLHLSLTRLSVRNLPRNVDEKHLKHLARIAVVGFVNDQRAGLREPLSREELQRDFVAGNTAPKHKRGGIVRQVKIVNEKDGQGRSRGYGFIEYDNHKHALMGLRWLNGHNLYGDERDYAGIKLRVDHISKDAKEGTDAASAARPKRAIVEFAIENAQVVKRRADKQQRAAAASSNVEEEPASRAQQRGRPAPREQASPKRGRGNDSKRKAPAASNRGHKRRRT